MAFKGFSPYFTFLILIYENRAYAACCLRYFTFLKRYGLKGLLALFYVCYILVNIRIYESVLFALFCVFDKITLKGVLFALFCVLR